MQQAGQANSSVNEKITAGLSQHWQLARHFVFRIFSVFMEEFQVLYRVLRGFITVKGAGFEPSAVWSTANDEPPRTIVHPPACHWTYFLLNNHIVSLYFSWKTRNLFRGHNYFLRFLDHFWRAIPHGYNRITMHGPLHGARMKIRKLKNLPTG